jgi:hypothetical protein
MKVAAYASVGFYIACVGFLALLRSWGLLRTLPSAEMFYGPALLIASTWILFGVVAFVGARFGARGGSSDG